MKGYGLTRTQQAILEVLRARSQGPNERDSFVGYAEIEDRLRKLTLLKPSMTPQVARVQVLKAVKQLDTKLRKGVPGQTEELLIERERGSGVRLVSIPLAVAEVGLTRTSLWHSGYDYDIGGESEWLERFGIPFLRDKVKKEGLSGLTLADLGCWSGRHLNLLKALAGPNGRVFGIDEPFAGDRLAQARLSHPGVTVLDCGISRTGLGSSALNGAICWRVLHNLTRFGELSSALLEFRRILQSGAPLVIAVRFTQAWMIQNAPFPLIHRTYYQGGEREDLYFSKKAIESTFPLYDFQVHRVEEFHEEEEFEGKRITNEYLMALLTCGKLPPPSRKS